MKSIVISGIDPELNRKIVAKSKELGLSQNKAVKEILIHSLESNKKEEKRKSFLELFGKWSDKEYAEFTKRIEDLEKTDNSDWKK
jgi:hypothetical protein